MFMECTKAICTASCRVTARQHCKYRLQPTQHHKLMDNEFVTIHDDLRVWQLDGVTDVHQATSTLGKKEDQLRLQTRPDPRDTECAQARSTMPCGIADAFVSVKSSLTDKPLSSAACFNVADTSANLSTRFLSDSAASGLSPLPPCGSVAEGIWITTWERLGPSTAFSKRATLSPWWCSTARAFSPPGSET